MSPEALRRINIARRHIHHAVAPCTYFAEHACAAAYAVHEALHFSALIVWTAYGFLIVGFIHIVTWTKERVQ